MKRHAKRSHRAKSVTAKLQQAVKGEASAEWWWRTPRDEHWKDTLEVSAFRYECCRRLDLSLPPWPKLDMFAKGYLAQAIGERYSIATTIEHPSIGVWMTWEGGGINARGHIQQTGNGVVVKPLGLDKPNYTWPVQFNLAAKDYALEIAFKRFLKEQRRIHSAKPPKRGGRKSVSWLPLEVWDAHHIDGTNAGTRSRMLTTVRENGERYLPAATEALKNAAECKKSFVSQKPK